MSTWATDLWPVRVLFLCWHNDVRSPLAEAVLRHRGQEQFLARSAGIVPTRLHPLALTALADGAVEGMGLYAKRIHLLRDEYFDVLVTLCERTRAAPDLPAAAIRLHWSIPDPLDAADPAAQRAACAAVCAELWERVRLLMAAERRRKRHALTTRWPMGALPVEDDASGPVGRP